MPTILVVDDDPLVRGMLKIVLTAHGFHIVTAENGADALRLAHSPAFEFDLMISDLEMPEISGAQLSAEVQADRPQMPIVLISGSCANVDLPSLGSIRFLSKPLDLPALLNTVRQLLAHRTMRVSA
jgi:DNA-binding NtrC family response regulator